ncbi:MAG: hypothetical protein JW881_11130 [Spirochaetales bacterium]|nr:hypothetical protein [Spirochaetales bacterium]
MKYELETIPIWEAFKEENECPLCLLKHKLEKDFVQFFLGGAVMQPDIRGTVNEYGFCEKHNDMLHAGGNKLGLALMTHTHLKQLLRSLERQEKKIGSYDKSSRRFTLKKGVTLKELSSYTNFLDQTAHTCVLCNKLLRALERYSFTTVYLWKKDTDFRKAFLSSKGFCLLHAAGLILMADETLRGNDSRTFIEELITIQKKNLARLEEEIHWYTQKFDYRHADEPWKTSKDALPRTIGKLVGTVMK